MSPFKGFGHQSLTICNFKVWETHSANEPAYSLTQGYLQFYLKFDFKIYFEWIPS